MARSGAIWGAQHHATMGRTGMFQPLKSIIRALIKINFSGPLSKRNERHNTINTHPPFLMIRAISHSSLRFWLIPVPTVRVQPSQAKPSPATVCTMHCTPGGRGVGVAEAPAYSNW